MGEVILTCPRCFAAVPLRAELRFCPRCGLAGMDDAAIDTSPVDLAVNGRSFRIADRIAVGSVCVIYRCHFPGRSGPVEGVFKIARDARANRFVANEAGILRQLHAADATGRFTPFIPAVEDTFGHADDASAPPRQANVLRMHEEIRSPGELYTLAEARVHYPGGLDARDVAWIWRRLLNILGFAHAQDVVHGAVLPMQVLIEPRGHRLLLVDWCCATPRASSSRDPVTVITPAYVPWYRRQEAAGRPPTPTLDIAFGARCMIELLAGDPLQGTTPPTVDPAIGRYFQRCLDDGPGGRADAWKLLDEFDDLIGALWGPRRFHAMELPPRGRP